MTPTPLCDLRGQQGAVLGGDLGSRVGQAPFAQEPDPLLVVQMQKIGLDRQGIQRRSFVTDPAHMPRRDPRRAGKGTHRPPVGHAQRPQQCPE
jgi:hypothetical protein